MAKLFINPHKKLSKINKEIYGHFSEHLGRCIYEGLYVGENSKIPNTNGMRNDVVSALKAIKIPVLRWPGGCFADEYHWKDGIGEKSSRKKMINTHWGGVVEDNSFGTHEFMELCKQLECQPYINGNLGSGTVAEMSEWVEYMTFSGVSPMAELRTKNGQSEPWAVKYFAVGNENWGCGGNMRPSFYADLYRRYATYIRNYGENKLYKIACGANSDDYVWTDTVMDIAGQHMDGLSLHYYTVDWSKKGSATDFDENSWYSILKSTLRMDEIISRHSAIMDKYDVPKRVGLLVDEWGTWFDVEPGTNPGFLFQQNTMRDALVAAINLNIFNKHSDRVKMANIAQTVNVLQAMILTEGEKMVLTPSYHVFSQYKSHQEATLLDSFIETSCIGTAESQIPNLHESVSQNADGSINITVANLSVSEQYPIDISFAEMCVSTANATIVTGDMTAHNTFSKPNSISEQPFSELTIKDSLIHLTIPACSVISILVK